MPWGAGQPLSTTGTPERKWMPDAATVTYTSGIKVRIGQTWEYKPLKVWDGTAWIAKPVKVWTGTTWRLLF